MNFTSYSPICIQLFSKYLGLFLPLGGGLRSTAHFWVKSECLGAFSLSSKETVGVWLSLSVIVDQHVQGAQRAQGVLGCPGCPWYPGCPWCFGYPWCPGCPFCPVPKVSPIPKFYTFLMEWGRGWVMPFPLVSLLFWGRSMIGHP